MCKGLKVIILMLECVYEHGEGLRVIARVCVSAYGGVKGDHTVVCMSIWRG